MQFLKAVALAALATAVSGADLIVTRGSKTVNYADLQKQLSRSAEIYKPGSDQFDDVVARWSNASTPDASIVVVPSNEQDIVKTVSKFSIQLTCMFSISSSFEHSIF